MAADFMLTWEQFEDREAVEFEVFGKLHRLVFKTLPELSRLAVEAGCPPEVVDMLRSDVRLARRWKNQWSPVQ